MDKSTQVSTFRHDAQISEAITDIINYLEKHLPGTQANASDAIRFAIITKAADIRAVSDNDKDRDE